MRDYHRELYDIMREIRKIKFSSMLPRITGLEFDALDNIARCAAKLDTVRISDVVKAMHIPAPAISRVMRSLEEDDLLIRKIDKSDRRNMIVELTDKGVKTLEKGARDLHGFASDVFEAMGKERTEQMVDALGEFARISRLELEKRKVMTKDEK